MRESQAIIERVRRVSEHLQQIDISVEPALLQLKPGQSLSVRLADDSGWDPYLRAQWIPVRIWPGSLSVELPVTPRGQRAWVPGDVLSVLSPVGQPIPLRPRLLHLLMLAYVPPTPLVLLAGTLTGGGVEVTLVLADDALSYPLELLPPEVEVLRGDTGWKWPDQVETLNWADQVLALAPATTAGDVYATLYNNIAQLRHHEIPENYVSGFFYQPLACGTGACGACQITGQRGDLLACADGPALDLKRVKLI